MKQVHIFTNIVVPISDGALTYNISVNLEKAYSTSGKEITKDFEKTVLLHIIDNEWKENLREMDDLRSSVQNAVYEQKDPLLIYKLETSREDIFNSEKDEKRENKNKPVIKEKKVGRNDPCPCGSGKKYKNCHGRLS